MKCVQTAIYWTVKQLEDITHYLNDSKVLLCDRGTLDGAAYWPETGKIFFDSLGTTREMEFARYDVVIHLKPPFKPGIYKSSGTRIESHSQAIELDAKTEKVWDGHTRRFIVADEPDFLVKVNKVMKILEEEIPKLQ